MKESNKLHVQFELQIKGENQPLRKLKKKRQKKEKRVKDRAKKNHPEM